MTRPRTLQHGAAESAAAGEHPLRGIALMVAAMVIVPLMDGLAKHLSADYPVLQVVWARYFFHLALLVPIVVWRYPLASLWPRRPVIQVLRGGLLLASTILFFFAIAAIPLADAIALVFVSPLVVTALSPFVLGEAVGVRRWSAVIVGFLGAMTVIRPGFQEIEPGSLMAIGAGSVYAFYLLTTRKLSGSAPPLVTLTYTALLGAGIMSLVAPFHWVPPDAAGLGQMIAMGAIAAVGHFLVIRAFDHAPAAVLAPFGYSEIVMATVIGLLAFGDFPDAWTWCGIAVLVASGIYISIREHKVRKS
jgi:drug/metabolite transporter (DMT)-like permease